MGGQHTDPAPQRGGWGGDFRSGGNGLKCGANPPGQRRVIFHRQHQHQIIRVCKLAIDVLPLQYFRQLLPGVAVSLGHHRQLQHLLPGQAEAYLCNVLLHRRPLRRRMAQRRPPSAIQDAVGSVQGLENQIRGAGGSKQRHGTVRHGIKFHRGMGGNVEIPAAGEHRQGLVGRVAAQVRPLGHGVLLRLQKRLISAMGIVYQQQAPISAANPA